MGIVYFLSVGLVGGLTVDFVAALFDGAETIDVLGTEVPFAIAGLGPTLSAWLTNVGASPWSVSLVVDGIIAGFGAVSSFLPQLIILFLCLALLETTGYMSRISFFLDRIFKRFGLSGKSLIPFIVGSGCSVPGIMASRTVETEEERKMTVMLTPFVPCSAKLPIIALFAGYFFSTMPGLLPSVSISWR
jgi:ferrous iron transport protein B